MPTRGQTAHLKQRFLAHFARCGNLTQVCAESGIGSRQTIYRWRDRDPRFAAAFTEAEAEATDRLEAEAHRRAAEGVPRLKFTARGTPILDPATGQQYIEHEYSDGLLMFLLRARAPEKYRERHDVQQRSEVAATATVAHEHRHELDLDALTVEQLRQLHEIIRAGTGGGEGEGRS